MAEDWTCHVCGTAVSWGTVVCPLCGSALSWEEEDEDDPLAVLMPVGWDDGALRRWRPAVLSAFSHDPSTEDAPARNVLPWLLLGLGGLALIALVITLVRPAPSPPAVPGLPTPGPTCTPHPPVTLSPETGVEGFIVVEESNDKLRIAVDVSYQGEYGETTIFVGALPRRDSQPSGQTYFGYQPKRVRDNDKPAEILIIYGYDDAPETWTTDQIEIFFYLVEGQEVLTQVFDYDKAWFLDAESGE